MIPNLLRKEFIDRVWDAQDLDAAAEFWLRLYESAARSQGFTATPSHAIEIRLRGFPRRDGQAICEELCRRVATSDIPAPEVDLHDADTLVLLSGEIPGSESPPYGLGMPLLAGPPFDGLVAEVRVQAIGREGQLIRRGKVQSTLVMVGELRGGKLLVKALWRTGSAGWEDELNWDAPWTEQTQWLAAFEQFRESEEVPAKLAKKLFLTRGGDRLVNWIVRLIHVPLGKPRLAGLMTRLFVFAAMFVPLGLGAYWAIDTERWLALVLFVVWLWWAAWLGWMFLKNQGQLWFTGFTEFHRRYCELYEEAVKVMPLPDSETARLDQAWARKYTADLEAAGFTLAGDLRPEPELAGPGVIRVFLAPDGATYLNVLFSYATHRDPERSFQLWPGAMVFLAYTYFPDGGRVVSVSGRHVGYRKKLSGPETLARVFPDAAEPLDFTRRHLAAVEEYAKENGRTPLSHERWEVYLRRQNEAQDEERRLYGERPYTRGDHWFWFIQQPRREYRG
jgi:hypothetical protein